MANAQSSGRISGTVIDATGAAVGGADVELFLAGGQKPLLTAKTSAEGIYNLIGVRPAEYDLTVSAPGFLKSTLRRITVDTARETDVPPVKLQLANLTQSIEVSGEVAGVDVATAEVSNTVSMEQIKNLPILDRDVLGILQTQAGVASNGNSTTVINGLRTSYSNMTLDGVNIQDNYIRDNALDYTPNKLRVGQVRQVTLITSNPNAAASGGATEAAFRDAIGRQRFSRRAVLVQPQQPFRGQRLVQQPERNRAALPQPESVRRRYRRTDPQGQAVLLRELRSHPRAPADAAGFRGPHGRCADRNFHVQLRRRAATR